MADTFQKPKVPFTQVPNEILYSQDLSMTAKCMYAYLMSKPNKWQFSSVRIQEEMVEGRFAIQSALKELEDAGYLKRKKLKTGRMKYQLLKNPMCNKPNVQKLHTAETAHISNTDNTSNTYKQSNTESADKSAETRKSRMSEPMTVDQFVDGCRENEQRYINLIGEYADQIKPNYETRGQWDTFLKRNLRSAKQLEPFTDKQIEQAVLRILKADYLDKWTLETVIKYLE